MILISVDAILFAKLVTAVFDKSKEICERARQPINFLIENIQDFTRFKSILIVISLLIMSSIITENFVLVGNLLEQGEGGVKCPLVPLQTV